MTNRGGAEEHPLSDLFIKNDTFKAALEPELPKPVRVSNLTDLSQAIKSGNGVAEVVMAPALLQNMIRQTMDNLIQARFSKFNPEVSVEIKIKNGLAISGNIKGKWGLIKANIPVTLRFDKRFNLESFNFESKFGDRNEIERELRGVLTQLNNSFRAELAKYKIQGSSMENPEIRDAETFTKFRGKVVK